MALTLFSHCDKGQLSKASAGRLSLVSLYLPLLLPPPPRFILTHDGHGGAVGHHDGGSRSLWIV